MSISSILSTGMQSIQASTNRTAIAGIGLNVEDSEFARKMVAMRQGEIDAKSANVIKTADQILGTIFDIRGYGFEGGSEIVICGCVVCVWKWGGRGNDIGMIESR